MPSIRSVGTLTPWRKTRSFAGVSVRNMSSSVRSSVKLRVHTDDIRLDIDTAIPIGLIVNELVTNAYKYAFDDAGEGEIFIGLEQTSDNLLTLKITDNGKGMSSSSGTAFSFGTQIISALCRQLRADWRIENEGGTIHTLLIKKFKRNEPSS